MKKLFPLLFPTSIFCILASIFYLLTSSPIFAQETTPTPTKKPLSEIRQEFRTKLAGIRDEKKKAIVEKMDQRISELNKKRTDLMVKHLAKIEEILNKVEARGNDTPAVVTAIATARSSIATAKQQVSDQSGKTYTIEITTEGRLGAAVSAVRTALSKDLQTAHQSVVTARKSVRDVLTALAKVVGEKLSTSTEK